MNDERRKEMATLVDAFDEHYRKGAMPIDLYSRSMVICAHEYMDQQENVLAAQTLRRCPTHYFHGTHQRQMGEDFRFEALSFDLARLLAAAGLINELDADGVRLTQFALGKA